MQRGQAEKKTSKAPAPEVNYQNLIQAHQAMNLTPQEVNLYNHHLTNLYGNGKVVHPDGSISTVFQTNVGIGGKHYNIPTVYDGKILSVDQAIQRARKDGLDKFPSYASPKEAEARYQQMHQYFEKDLQDYLQ